jgi:hypothetical protein
LYLKRIEEYYNIIKNKENYTKEIQRDIDFQDYFIKKYGSKKNIKNKQGLYDFFSYSLGMILNNFRCHTDIIIDMERAKKILSIDSKAMINIVYGMITGPGDFLISM